MSFCPLVPSQIQNLKDHLSQNEFLNPAVSFNELLPYPNNTTPKCTSRKQTAVLPENVLETAENEKMRRKLFPQQNINKQLIAQREFLREFGIDRNHVVPSTTSIKIWFLNVETTGSTAKKRGGSVKIIRTLDNVRAVREAIVRSQTGLLVAILSRLACPKPASDVSYTKIFIFTPTKSKTSVLYTHGTTQKEFKSAIILCCSLMKQRSRK
ncbi:hypothetical protein C0J52_11118 [Blattella germanica]|nr:hypothetical protein C0J52_11118 [Blattella germanica]